jgi:hypothetical protein
MRDPFGESAGLDRSGDWQQQQAGGRPFELLPGFSYSHLKSNVLERAIKSCPVARDFPFLRGGQAASLFSTAAGRLHVLSADRPAAVSKSIAVRSGVAAATTAQLQQA